MSAGAARLGLQDSLSRWLTHMVGKLVLALVLLHVGLSTGSLGLPHSMVAVCQERALKRKRKGKLPFTWGLSMEISESVRPFSIGQAVTEPQFKRERTSTPPSFLWMGGMSRHLGAMFQNYHISILKENRMCDFILRFLSHPTFTCFHLSFLPAINGNLISR